MPEHPEIVTVTTPQAREQHLLEPVWGFAYLVALAHVPTDTATDRSSR
jgi:hypothetical protein